MTHVTCRLTAKNQDKLRNHTLGNRVWDTITFTFTVIIIIIIITVTVRCCFAIGRCKFVGVSASYACYSNADIMRNNYMISLCGCCAFHFSALTTLHHTDNKQKALFHRRAALRVSRNLASASEVTTLWRYTNLFIIIIIIIIANC